jgi:triacylglycerol lipase
MPERPVHNILLIPGFFGFRALGGLSYFHGIHELLERGFAERGLRVRVIEVATLPTASIRVRAARIREVLAEIAAESAAPIHIVGHSTGGLDARLAIAPTASLPTRVRFDAYDQVHTLVSVCCSHFGSPVATFFSRPNGRRLLRVGSRYLIWLLERKQFPLAFTLRLFYWLIRLWRPLRKKPSTFDELYARLLDDLSTERRAELIQFLHAVSADESLVFQLTPAGCDLLNACTADPNLRYGSVVARAPKPSWRRFLRSFWDPYAQLMYPVYAFLYSIAARHEARWIPEAVGTQRQRLLEFYGELPSPSDNDGIVPTNSQIWGELVHATCADHLDVVGHFGRSDAGVHAGDWLPSHSEFDAARFERLWADVATFITADICPRVPAPGENPGTERTERDLKEDEPPALVV